SYDLPAFVELFARWSDTNNDKWESCLAPTRGHLEKSCHSSSGLFADYSEFNGQPTTGGFSENSNKYMYDAMRCAMNVGMDYYLFGADKKTQNAMMTRLINHFEKDGYQHARFNWDGTGGTESYTLGECGANAVGCFALMDDPANDEKVKTNLKKAWNGQLMTGQYRYYDGLVHYLAMLHLCGSFKIYKPAPSVTEITAQNEYNGVKYDSPTDIYDFKDCKLYKVAIEITDVENVKANGVAIVPNPASNKINIVAEEQINSVEIIDMIGNKVVSTNSSEISVANLPAGVYMAVISTEKAQFIKKVMIKR
ncbi:MAG: T9SS type A sorting domain-containing protein, partial [Paludibacteraceae bacterium]|nr:T9SS type A sorting domain-containing protein [Paludibacteraceae bacterium]